MRCAVEGDKNQVNDMVNSRLQLHSYIRTMDVPRGGGTSRRGGSSRGGSRSTGGGGGANQSVGSDSDSATDRRTLRNQANAVVRGGYRKKPRLQNIASFGESLGSGVDLYSDKPAPPPPVTFDSLREKQREQNERLLSQLAAQLDDDSDEEDNNFLSDSSESLHSSSNSLAASGERPVYVSESCQICLDRVRPRFPILAPRASFFNTDPYSKIKYFNCNYWYRFDRSRQCGCVHLVTRINFICIVSNPGSTKLFKKSV
jgi:hypothetical protein